MVIFEFAGRFCQALCSRFRLDLHRVALAPDLQKSRRDGGAQYQHSEHYRECRPRKMRRRQLTDEILQRLNGSPFFAIS